MHGMEGITWSKLEAYGIEIIGKKVIKNKTLLHRNGE